MIDLGRKNKSSGKNRDLTDFSNLIIKPKDTKEDNVEVNSIKTVEGNNEILTCKENHTEEE